MCSAENCARKNHKDSSCCWNHRGQIKSSSVVEELVEVNMKNVNYEYSNKQKNTMSPNVTTAIEPPTTTTTSSVIFESTNLELENNKTPIRTTRDILNIYVGEKPIGLWCGEYFAALSEEGKDIDNICTKRPNRELSNQGYSSVLQVEGYRKNEELDDKLEGGRFVYFKSDEDKNKFKHLAKNIDTAKYCLSNKLYDQRIYKLCCMLKPSWFCDTNNLWNLAGMLYQKQHADLDLMRKTYMCILRTMTERYCGVTAIKEFNDWETSKYFPKLNESQLKAIAGGSNPTAYKEWKNEYETSEQVESDKKMSALDMLKEKLLEVIGDTYKREYQTGVIYERQVSYYYTRKFEDTTLFLNHVFAKEPMWHNVSPKQHNDLVSFIKFIVHPGFEFIKLDYNYIGFKNGVYDLSTASFILADDIVDNIQVRKYVDITFDAHAEAPLLDRYLEYQFDEETIEFIYFMTGHLMTRLTDKFDFMVLLYGEGGSGKSLLMNLVKYTFGGGQIGIFGNSHQEKFGLHEYASKQIVCCDDMPSNLVKTLPKSDFLSMGTRGQVSCPVKGKGSIEVSDWNIPTLMNSNKLPNYSDESGEVVRRFMIINFEKVVEKEDRNTALEDEIKEHEFGVFLHRCRSKYLEFRSKYKGKGVDTFCPQLFLENRNLLRQATNNTYQYISDKYEYDEGTFVTLPDLNRAFKKYIQARFDMKRAPKDTINIANICLVDSRYRYEKLCTCKHCGNKHRKGCCADYVPEHRTTKEVIHNIRLLPE